MEIPKQLQNPNFRFVLLGKWDDVEEIKGQKPKYKGKSPFEKEWQSKNNYKFNDPRLLNHKNNFGVIGGYGKLRILDIDNKKLGDEFQKKLKTFTVETGGGGKHFYFISDYDKNHVLINELGELRAKNYQVVCAPCRHPSGKYYKVVKDVPIQNISSDDLHNLIKPYLRDEQQTTEKESVGKDTSRSGLEYRKVLALLREGKSREEIYKIMEAYSKWSSGTKQYKSLTFEKAEIFYLQEKDGKPQEKREITRKELKNVYYKIVRVLREFMDLKEEDYSLIALWIIGTHFHKKFSTYPYLFFNAMRGSGKSRILNIISALSYNGKNISSLTESVLFRTAQDRTFCIDEFEGVGSKDKTNLRLLLNSAYKKGVKVERTIKKKSLAGERFETESFDVYCPVAMANIWGMENVLSDRCVTIILEKSNKESVIDLIEDFDTNPLFFEIKEELNNVTLGDFTNIFQEWNKYIKNVTNVSKDTNNINVTNVKIPSDVSDMTLPKKLYKPIKNANLHGRDLELFFPFFITSQKISSDVFEKTIETAKKIIKERKESDREENKDVQFIEFISQYNTTDYVSVTKLSNDFKDFLETDDKWINSKWTGRALRRLNLILDKRRTGKSREVKLNIPKAKEKLLMFKDVDEINFSKSGVKETLEDNKNE